MKPNNIIGDRGTGVIKYEGVQGDFASLSTRIFDLYNAVNPLLEFWYYHDTSTSITDNSFMDLYVVADGVDNHEMRIRKGQRAGVVHGWNYYSLPLNNYTQSHCVLIRFDAMTQFVGGASRQFMDRIIIDAYKNVALTELIVPTLEACDFNNKEIKVVMYNTSSLGVNFLEKNTSINLRINSQDYTVAKNSGYLLPYTSDTIVMTTAFNFVPGQTYDIRAWIADPIDDTPWDDTTSRFSIFIDTDIEIVLTPTTNATAHANCVRAGYEIYQEYTLYNNSKNFDLYDVPVRIEVNDGDGNTQDVFYDTVAFLPKDDFVVRTLSEAYFAPEAVYGYNVVAYAELDCDYIKSNNNNIAITECVDMNDISVLEITSPNSTVCDTIGDAMSLEVKLQSASPYDFMPQDVVVHAIITAGANVQTLTGNVTLQPEAPTTYKFTNTYTVPDASNYTIKVFITNVDQYPINDTLSEVTRCAVKSDNGVPTINNSGFVLGQNIPNPAKENTRIEYDLPEDGQVIFTIYTITGQALFVEKRDAVSGKNEIEFNTENLANGVYYYAMEYKGERLVKKMTIRK